MPPWLLRGQGSGRRGSGRFPFCFRRRNFLFLRSEELDSLCRLGYGRLRRRSDYRFRNGFYYSLRYRNWRDDRYGFWRKYRLFDTGTDLRHIETGITGDLTAVPLEELPSPVLDGREAGIGCADALFVRDALVVIAHHDFVDGLRFEAGILSCSVVLSETRAPEVCWSGWHGARGRGDSRNEEQYGDKAEESLFHKRSGCLTHAPPPNEPRTTTTKPGPFKDGACVVVVLLGVYYHDTMGNWGVRYRGGNILPSRSYREPEIKVVET